MKAMFVSISWLYLNFAVFLIGIELMVTLRQKDALLLKGLFDDLPNQQHYLHTLMHKYGKTYAQGEVIFEQGSENRHYYMVRDGSVQLVRREQNGTSQILRILQNGDFFGEIALFSSQPATASAIVTSQQATLIEIYAEYMDNLLQEDPKIAVRLLKQLSGNAQIKPALNALT